MSDPELERILKEKAKSLKESIGKVETTMPLNLTTENFDQVINSDKPVIVDFWAEWCAPCLYMVPAFENLAKKYDGKIIFGRLNVDENRDISTKYQVFSIPTFMVFKDGKPSDIAVGAIGERGLEKLIAKYIES
ncbi:MAG: thioredoxin [Candidatus Methylarchaceae archaeon HK02M2]|nr:thioredoxin [Candidatus Methylarchaceae archaeon HK02M2]